MKLFAYLLLCFGFMMPALAQTNPTDSLKKAIDAYPKQDTVRAEMLITYGASLVRYDLNEAIKYTDEGEKLSHKLNWQRGIVSCLRQKGAIYIEKGSFAKGIEYQLKALKAFEKMKNVPNETRKGFEATIYLNVALAYGNLNRFEEAIKYNLATLKLSKELNHPLYLAYCYLNIGSNYINEKKYNLSEPYLDSAFLIAKKNQIVNIIPVYYSNKGLIKVKTDKWEDALTHLSAGEKLVGNDMITLHNIIQNKAIAYYELHDYKNARTEALKASALAKKFGLAYRESGNEVLFANIFEKTGDYKSAYEHYVKWVALRDSTIGEQKRVDAVKMTMKYEAEKEKALDTEEIKHQKQIRNYSIYAAIGVITLLGIIFFLYKKRRDDLQKQKELAHRTQSLETELRILRLQMNPHFMFNSLNSISDYIRKNDIEKADYYLSKFARLMRAILEKSEEKEIPLSDELLMLSTYMDLEAARMDNQFTYNIHIDEAIDPENTYIPPLLLQPFVENSVWHGFKNKTSPGLIKIDVRKENNMLKITLDDNGSGIKPGTDSKKSYGIKITRERLALADKQKNTPSSVQLIPLSEGTRVEILLAPEEEVC